MFIFYIFCLVQEHPWFCSLKMDELVDLIMGLKAPADISSFSNRLSCLHLLLVHSLKVELLYVFISVYMTTLQKNAMLVWVIYSILLDYKVN